MGKDFKIGLISGVVLGFVALIWVATRPSQSPRARMLGPTTVSPIADCGLRVADSFNHVNPKSEIRNPQPHPLPARTTRRPPQARRPNEPNTAREQRREKITTTRFHIVQRGETLSSISLLYYGSAHRWQKILEANPEAIKDANKISPGTKLVIPD